jgi:hypothetical protein
MKTHHTIKQKNKKIWVVVDVNYERYPVVLPPVVEITPVEPVEVDVPVVIIPVVAGTAQSAGFQVGLPSKELHTNPPVGVFAKQYPVVFPSWHHPLLM